MAKRLPRESRGFAPRGQSGFTLMEIVITISVIGILAAIVIPMFSITLNLANDARTVTAATYSAKFYIEQAQQATQSAIGFDANGNSTRCRTALEGTNVTLLPATFPDGKDNRAFTLRRYVVQGCTQEAEELRDQVVIARIEAREGTDASNKVIANVYYSVFVPGFYADSQ